MYQKYQFIDLEVDKLKLNENNPRSISDEMILNLKKSIQKDEEFLKVRPVIVNTYKGREFVVIGGNMRVLAARELKWKKIPCVTVSVPPSQEKIWMTKDNKSYGQWDDDKLAELVFELNKAGEDMGAMGLEKKEVERLLGSVSKDGEEPVVTKRLVYKLGTHKLICGKEEKEGEIEAITSAWIGFMSKD